jgi:hypothetical protein
MQLLLLILVTGAYVPRYILKFIKEFRFAMFSSEILQLTAIPGIGHFLDLLHESQDDQGLNDINIFSESALVVNFTMLIGVAIFALLHFFLKLYIQKFVNQENEGKWFNKVLVGLMNIMTFSFYIRVTIVVFQVLLLSSLSEIYAFETHDTGSVLSLIIAFGIFSACLAFLGFFTIHFAKSSNDSSKTYDELYRGLKDNKASKSYDLVSLSRKTLLIFIIVFIQEADPEVIVALMCVTQLVFLVWLCYLRPFKELQNNIVEIVNESVFALLLIIFCFNSKGSDWTDETATFVFYILIINMAVVFLVVVAFAALRLVKWYYGKKKMPSIPVIENENDGLSKHERPKYEKPNNDSQEVDKECHMMSIVHCEPDLGLADRSSAKIHQDKCKRIFYLVQTY